ncbi:MAG: cytochrome c-type biosis protein [Actinomycetota bacterium]
MLLADAGELVRTSPVGFVVAFGGGMLSFLSPCVLPLVPGYLSLMSGVSAGELIEPTADDRRRVLRATLLFVGGFTLVFTFLFAGASAVGQTLVDHQRGLNQVAGIVTIVMGLLIAGVVSPRLLQQERRLHVSPSRLGVFAPPAMGMAFAFGWTPCIGPILAAVLPLAAAQGTLARGMGMLVAYSLGLGVPFVAAGLALGRLTSVFAFVKRHFRALNLASGLLLIAFGFLLLTSNVTWLSGWFSDRMQDVPLLNRLTEI